MIEIWGECQLEGAGSIVGKVPTQLCVAPSHGAQAASVETDKKSRFQDGVYGREGYFGDLHMSIGNFLAAERLRKLFLNKMRNFPNRDLTRTC